LPGYINVPYSDLTALRAVLEAHGPRVAGFLVEPVQGEAGVIVPAAGYLREAAALCRQHNVLFIADEIQSVRWPVLARLACCLPVC
jgi:ornithine--oxo-acid transaminase